MELPSARPYAYAFWPERTALCIIDMQRDFLDFNGFGEIQCGNPELFRKVRSIVPKTQQVLKAARASRLHVIHTREGHKPDLSDLPPSKRLRQISAPNGHHTMGIGDQGPMGRLLVRGEYGHDIIDELQPIPGEVVIDKPGKGSFWSTKLHRALLARGVTHLLFAGVTTECCVNTTAREAADRGFECCVLADCTDGFYEPFYTSTLDMLCSYDGLFGFVGSSEEFLRQVPSQMTLCETLPGSPEDISCQSLRRRYIADQVKPSDIIKQIIVRIAEYQKKDPAVWTYLRSSADLLKDAQAIEERFAGKALPELYGIPFAVKDNIDVAGIRTSVACEAYAYTPTASAKIVDDLLAAGAILIGKTNLDQFATGLSGCRSPYGAPRSVYGRDRISGGSSSGSSVAVGAGLVAFALGTDTAGSGRVPAAFNGITGFKPTIGTISATGLVPACKSLDTVSILARTVADARMIWLAVDKGPDLSDPYAKTQQSLALWHADFRGVKAGGFRFGLPPQNALQQCDETYRTLFNTAVDRLKRAGGTPQRINWKPFEEGSNLLYEKSLVLERIACIGPDFIQQNLDTLHKSIQAVLGGAMKRDTKPWDVFRDKQDQAQYTREAAEIFQQIDVLMVPTTTCQPTVDEMEADPLALNAKLGYFTHFGNVLDLCGIAVPAGTYQTAAGETLPFGVTLLGAPGTDGKIFDIAREFERTP